MGDDFVFSEPEVVPKTRQEERDEVYVPFTPGLAPPKVKTSSGSPPLKKKAADYMPFVPISERNYKSDPCILDLDMEPDLVSGSMPASLQRSVPELVKLRSKVKQGKEQIPFDYLSFVPLAQMAKSSASEAKKASSEKARRTRKMKAKERKVWVKKMRYLLQVNTVVTIVTK
ncbi:MAG: hypothetical protein MPK62_14740 [Alphaproteobacteria bacterium]|nr:hypothetical protein [Alphaproteobacteria bacterium]